MFPCSNHACLEPFLCGDGSLKHRHLQRLQSVSISPHGIAKHIAPGLPVGGVSLLRLPALL